MGATSTGLDSINSGLSRRTLASWTGSTEAEQIATRTPG